MLTKEKIVALLDEKKKTKEQLIALLQQCAGQEAILNDLVKEFDKPE